MYWRFNEIYFYRAWLCKNYREYESCKDKLNRRSECGNWLLYPKETLGKRGNRKMVKEWNYDRSATFHLSNLPIFNKR